MQVLKNAPNVCKEEQNEKPTSRCSPRTWNL